MPDKEKNIKVLFFGDIVGKIGRQALKKALPQLKKKYSPDFVMANAENLAHGIGITAKTLQEMKEAGIDFFTSGNHIWKKEEANEILEKSQDIIRPANYANKPGHGWQIAKIKNRSLLIINLMGRTFIEDELKNPFQTVDDILAENQGKKLAGTIVDFHAEATSDKVALGWHLDGRVSAVIGTHTHIPTADAKILPKGTAYITDAGMVGASDSVLGVVKENILEKFVKETAKVHEIPEKGECLINAVLITIDPATGLTTDIKRIDKTVMID